MASLEKATPKTILVVDDEQDVLILLKLILETSGYRALLAPGAETALKLLGQDDLKVDLLLTDVVMPGMSGTELARVSRELRPDLPILFMTGFADTEAVRLKVWDDTVQLLRKPFTEEVFIAEICKLLGAVPLPTTPPEHVQRASSLEV